ncbi:MAG: hypothetical protein ACI9CP_001494 [Cryomorphaceae bacterium]|jgi:hypothetical protein
MATIRGWPVLRATNDFDVKNQDANLQVLRLTSGVFFCALLTSFREQYFSEKACQQIV